MAKKGQKREWVWLQCTETGDLNYRTSVNVQGGVPKFTLKKFSPRLRRRTVHKIKRK
jgi:large subunit ribosomal protein L33